MLTLVVTIISVLLTFSNCDEQDRVSSFPGLPSKLPFKTYSGYLNASHGVYLHYVFMESQRNPSKDPLLLWLNGGPGCSSLGGLFTEQGPYRINGNGTGLEVNPFAWNRISNMLFLESPAGVGFSYSDSKNYTTNDDATSWNNFLALGSFFKKFPKFRNNDFYVTGESYAGVYIPTLSVRLLKDPSIKYKGFAIGNGYLDQEKLGNSAMFFAYYHGLIDRVTWAKLTILCCSNGVSERSCQFYKNSNPECNNLVSKVKNDLASIPLNPYNVYDVCENVNTTSRSAGKTNRVAIGRLLLRKSMKLDDASAAEVIPCTDDSDITGYLNRRDVRKALNIPDFVPKWTDCSDDVASKYVMQYISLKDQVARSIKAGKRGLIYNGDVDWVCDFLGDQWFVEDLGFPAISDYYPWYTPDRQIAGFVKHFKGITLATVRGAGHMVPTDRPAAAFKMISAFLENRRFN